MFTLEAGDLEDGEYSLGASLEDTLGGDTLGGDTRLTVYTINQPHNIQTCYSILKGAR